MHVVLRASGGAGSSPARPSSARVGLGQRGLRAEAQSLGCSGPRSAAPRVRSTPMLAKGFSVRSAKGGPKERLPGSSLPPSPLGRNFSIITYQITLYTCGVSKTGYRSSVLGAES